MRNFSVGWQVVPGLEWWAGGRQERGEGNVLVSTLA